MTNRFLAAFYNGGHQAHVCDKVNLGWFGQLVPLKFLKQLLVLSHKERNIATVANFGNKLIHMVSN